MLLRRGALTRCARPRPRMTGETRASQARFVAPRRRETRPRRGPAACPSRSSYPRSMWYTLRTSVTPVGDEAGRDERGAAAQVRRLDDRPAQRPRPGDHGVVAAGLDAGAEAVELVDHDEPVLEDVLGDDRGPFGEGEQHHGLRLQVGGEPGVRQRGDVDRGERAVTAHRDALLALLDVHAHRPRAWRGRARGGPGRDPTVVTRPPVAAPMSR